MAATSSNHRPVAIVTLCLACMLLVVGCSKSGSSASGASSTTTPGASSTTTPGGSSTTTSAASTVSTTCLSVSEMAALVGTTFPAPQVSSGSGSTLCSYSDTSSGANVVLEFTKADGTTASALKSAMESQSATQHATATAVSGLGDAPYMFTLDDASTNSSGIATTKMEILDGSWIIDCGGEETVAHVEALATYLVGRH